MTISTIAATLGLVLFPLAMIYAGLMDLVTLKIRNHLVLAIGVGVAGSRAACRLQPAELGASAAVAAGVFVVTFTFFALGWIGGGDAKLAAVTALWFQPEQALLYFTYAAFLGGILTLGHPAASDRHAADGALSRAVDRPAARRQDRRSLWRGDGAGRADRLSRDRLGGARGLLKSSDRANRLRATASFRRTPIR